MLPLWQSMWLLFATAATATISPSNTSTLDSPPFSGTLPLNRGNGDQAKIADLIPLTQQAAQQTVEGSLHNVNSSSTVANIADGNIAYINCNNADFPGFVDPQKLLEDVYNQGNISGVILYSTVTDYCDYNPNNNQQMMQQFAVFSMTNQQASASLLNDVSQSSTFPVKVQGRGGDSGSGNGSFAGQNPLGPSPSTAVAMIILYSITGIITALFLVIIVTGAIRAHRHPERYGPRNVLGRPRQSRARGLGRAILETIPIVKFGEKEPAKPTDVELASTAETSRSVNGVTSQADGATTGLDDTPDTTAAAETTQAKTVPLAEDHQEGIAAAQPAATSAAAAGTDTSSHDDTLGCSICTEDFEKGQDLRVLPCDHKFHPECVDPWLLNVSGTCPLCRVDLRPVTSNDSSASNANPDDSTPTHPPATDAEAAETSHHRTAFRDMLSLRYRPNATPQERIFYLRRLRDQRRNRGQDVAEGTSSAAAGAAGTSDEADRRRSKRMSARLSGVFGGRARRDRSPQQQQQGGESSRDAQHDAASAGPSPPGDEAGAGASGSTNPRT